MKRIILASGSPRRRELLKNAGLKFEIHPSGYEETLDSDIFTPEKIENLAYNKALDVAKEYSEGIIIGADTVVVLNNKILTKPHDRTDAYIMLKNLSGVPHTVVTGICVINKYTNKTKIKAVTTTVEFESLTDEQINFYIDHFKPFDKAGAYGIQEMPKEYIKNVEGSFENVIGLCTKTVKEMIED
ncbi:MAG: Maf family protein [Cyanobacteria bacterium RUI128]|nr:Maf family protein [Cyanobacteria bacterium RUI128]